MARMGSLAAAGWTFVEANSIVLALLACLVLGGVLYLRLSRSRRRLRSRLEAANTQLDELRSRDATTGLVTPAEFEAALELAALECDRSRQSLAVMYLGLDSFKLLNDGYDRNVGNALLQQVGQRLQTLVGSGPVVTRLHGDEFVLVVPGDRGAAHATANTLQIALQEPFDAAGQSLRISASVGIAMYPEHGARPRLLSHAEQAMRVVKMGGGNGHAFFDPAIAVDQREQAHLLQELRRALECHQLELFYQPKIDARSLQVTAAEALLRWKHPQRGMVSPAVFIPLAERHGLIVAIGNWVIDEACRQAAEWREGGLRMRVAINISGHQLRQDDLVPRILAALQRHSIPPGRLTVEITETAAMEDTTQTRAAFEQLRRSGLHVSIDDFGVGLSALAYLNRRLPIDELKIDQSFVKELDTSDAAQKITSGIVQIAHSLGKRVVAEGVETEAQRDALLQLGCDELQGYLFARPMSARALALFANDGDAPAGGHGGFRASLFDPTQPAPLGD